MAVAVNNFTTGPSTLPDVGTLSYNGCVFSPLFATTVSGSAVKDDARRTVKFMEYSLAVDGYVTLPTGALSVSPTMAELRRLLSAQGGALVYRGRGCDIVVNAGGALAAFGSRDVAWGPVPELLEFQPLGGGLSAKVRWVCKTRIPEATAPAGNLQFNKLQGGFGGLAAVPLLQFNYDTAVTYSEDGFSTLTVRGVLEIPLTRTPGQSSRGLTTTADDMRSMLDARIMAGIDLSRFRVTRRNFPLSRDKRTLDWEVVAEERPYMDPPRDCPIARGTYSVRPAKAGMGLATWLCTLRGTYVVRADRPRRMAWFAFLSMLRLRMAESARGHVPRINGEQEGLRPPIAVGHPALDFARFAIFYGQLNDQLKQRVLDSRRAWLMDFSFDEGMYLDSKTITFSATWRLVTTFSHILLASGVWKKLPERDPQNKSLWALSMADVSGSRSWLPNRVDPSLDVIVDFGGG